MKLCGEWAWYHPKKGLSRFFCGHASCHRAECHNLFWSRRVRLLSALIDEHDLVRFFTLTLDPEFIEGDPWEYIHAPWSKMRKRLRRINPDFKFVAILESHKDRDVPHIHGFTNLWLEQERWSLQWHASRGGRVVWIEQVKDQNLSNYVSKSLEVARYVGKENLLGGKRKNKGTRTLWRSKNLKAKYELTTEPGWVIIKEPVYKDDGEMTDYWTQKGVWHGGQDK